MAKHLTRWRPDTCGCVIEYEWDSDRPEEARRHGPLKLDACPDRPASGDLDADFATILAHNRAANAEA